MEATSHNADEEVESEIRTYDDIQNLFDLDDMRKGLVMTFFVSGNLVGAMLSSFVSDRIGRRKALMASCSIFIVGGLLQAFSYTINELFVGRIVSGMAIGVTTSLVPLYNSELAPGAIRGQLVSFNQVLYPRLKDVQLTLCLTVAD